MLPTLRRAVAQWKATRPHAYLRKQKWAAMHRTRDRVISAATRRWAGEQPVTVVRPRSRARLSRRRAGATVIGVYRARNVPILRAFLAAERLDPDQVRLWALDSVHPALRNVTVGVGGGGKFDLLNRTLSQTDLRDDDYLVITDDDVLFMGAKLRPFLNIARRAEFGVVQPAHSVFSYLTHWFVRRRRASIARLTTYVANGPLFAVSPEWRDRVIPFPADVGLGWGIEFEWSRLQDEGCRLGIVDAVRLLHCYPPGHEYARDTWNAEMRRLNGYLERENAPSIWDLQNDLAVWRPWQRKPPWLRQRVTGDEPRGSAQPRMRAASVLDLDDLAEPALDGEPAREP